MQKRASFGRKRTRAKSAGLKVLHGTERRYINRHEPRPDPLLSPPEAPKHLQGDARSAWKRLAPQLHAKGLLTSWDLALFEAYCTAYQLHRVAQRELEADGGAVTVRYGGRRAKHPALQIIRDAAATMLSISKRFGLTPADRADIRVQEPEKDDGLSEILDW